MWYIYIKMCNEKLIGLVGKIIGFKNTHNWPFAMKLSYTQGRYLEMGIPYLCHGQNKH